jgi:hypothetical protein
MDRHLLLTIVLVFSLGCQTQPFLEKPLLAVESTPTPSIRLLCIKHSREHMADGDANLAIQAVRTASSKGLNIKVVGNHFVDDKLVYYQIIENRETLSQYVEQYIKADATPGDTLVIFTIGHGFPNGGLHNIGQREEIMKIIASIAEKHNQKVFWWQLSCYAAAKLPPIESLTPAQQKLVSIYATSSASQTSAAYVQGHIMEKIFLAIADKSPAIDPNKDGKITAAELRTFMGNNGQRIYANSPEYTIFGKTGIPVLPIVDRNNHQKKYEEEYIFGPN